MGGLQSYVIYLCSLKRRLDVILYKDRINGITQDPPRGTIAQSNAKFNTCTLNNPNLELHICIVRNFCYTKWDITEKNGFNILPPTTSHSRAQREFSRKRMYWEYRYPLNQTTHSKVFISACQSIYTSVFVKVNLYFFFSSSFFCILNKSSRKTDSPRNFPWKLIHCAFYFIINTIPKIKRGDKHTRV